MARYTEAVVGCQLIILSLFNYQGTLSIYHYLIVIELYRMHTGNTIIISCLLYQYSVIMHFMHKIYIKYSFCGIAKTLAWLEVWGFSNPHACIIFILYSFFMHNEL